MFLIDTNVISEARKGARANPGVIAFFKRIKADETPIFLSVVTVGELRRGIEAIRYRGDLHQAANLEKWLIELIDQYANFILDFDTDTAQLWGKLRVPHYENALDKQIAATALLYDLTVVTRNQVDFSKMGLRILNPFQ